MNCPFCKQLLDIPQERLSEGEGFHYDCSHCSSSLFFEKGECQVLAEGRIPDPAEAEEEKQASRQEAAAAAEGAAAASSGGAGVGSEEKALEGASPASLSAGGDSASGSGSGASDDGERDASFPSEEKGGGEVPADEAVARAAKAQSADESLAANFEANPAANPAEDVKADELAATAGAAGGALDFEAPGALPPKDPAAPAESESSAVPQQQLKESIVADEAQAPSSPAVSPGAEAASSEIEPADDPVAEASFESVPESPKFPDPESAPPSLSPPPAVTAPATPAGPAAPVMTAPAATAIGPTAPPASSNKAASDSEESGGAGPDESEEEKLEDFSDLERWGNLPGAAHQGPFFYNLLIEDINSQETREYVKEVLSDEALNLPPVKIKGGSLRLPRLSPAAAHVIVKALIGRPLTLSWEQELAAEAEGEEEPQGAPPASPANASVEKAPSEKAAGGGASPSPDEAGAQSHSSPDGSETPGTEGATA